MTGTAPRTHGDRVYRDTLRMPELPTLAGSFRNAGYQTFAAGKLHVYPQRNRIGFDEVLLAEEGRRQFGVVDDYEMFLADIGQPGRQFAHGMSNNQYVVRPWHLEERLHVTNWVTEQMCRALRRRDPTRPGLFYLSHPHPHPPLVPLPYYLELYKKDRPTPPPCAEWARSPEQLPPALRVRRNLLASDHPGAAEEAREAFYALCTQIDHQLRVVIGTLREEGILDNTVILFTSDHGDMLGTHNLWSKRLFYEPSARIPMLLVDPRKTARISAGAVDDRLVCLRDVMPTLLDLAGIAVPDSVEGLSFAGTDRREWLYGEIGETPAAATRMVTDGRHKLIYYPAGNRFQLFDLFEDPNECRDLTDDPAYQTIRSRISELLIKQLYGGDLDWVREGRLVGTGADLEPPRPDPGLSGQRGI